MLVQRVIFWSRVQDEDTRAAAAADLVPLALSSAALTQPQCNAVRTPAWPPRPDNTATRLCNEDGGKEFICVQLGKCAVGWKRHTRMPKNEAAITGREEEKKKKAA